MSERIIALLNEDMKGEHQAIIQYLYHAYLSGDEELACEIEAIAREEMRHYDWLADAITELVGDPTVERAEVDFDSAPLQEQLLKNAALEQMAVDQYRAHMEEIQDESLRRLLARIVHDEVVHKGQFESLAETVAAQAASGEAEAGEAATEEGKPPERLAEILNEGVRHEYSVILQYLYHSFVTPDKEIMEHMQNIAINEMQHLGWLAEELAEKGGDPDMSHGDLVLTRDHEEMLEADRKVEQEVTRAYSEQIPEIADQEVRELVERIRDHEIYHDAVFEELLEEVTEEEAEQRVEEPDQPDEDASEEPPARPIPSVGSLKE